MTEERGREGEEDREEEYKRTCHVHGQTRQYERGREREEGGQERTTKQKQERGVRVHLSRLWTDTQARRKSQGGRNDRVAQMSKLNEKRGVQSSGKRQSNVIDKYWTRVEQWYQEEEVQGLS